MSIMENIILQAKATPQRVAFPEAENEKILLAAMQCKQEGICIPVFVGAPEKIKAAASAAGLDIGDVEIIDSFDAELVDREIAEYVKTHTLLSAKNLKRRCADPMYVALILQANGAVDVTFAGIDHTTGDVILSGQTIVGLQEGVTTISSLGLCDIPGFQGSEGSLLLIGDSAVCTNPDSEELASIAISACDTARTLLKWEPRCALVSYSTMGSGQGELVDKVVEAVKIANQKRPDLHIEGEFQFDAAIVPAVAKKKVKVESNVAGKANIVIWPDLNVGNVAVKLIQQFGHADAYGPILQGFAKIVCDCSRGAPVSEMVGNIAMSCVRAQGVGK